MALWAKTQQLQGDALRQIKEVYGSRFPIEVRHYFAQWIEQQPWQEIDEDNPQHEGLAKQLFDGIVNHLQNKSEELNSDDMFLVKLKFQEVATSFKELYGSNPLNLVRVVKNGLATETRLVQQAEQAQTQNLVHGAQPEKHRVLQQQFDFLQRKTQETELDLRQLQHKQESFIIQYQDSAKINAQIAQLANQPNGQTKVEYEEKLKKQKSMVELQLTHKAQEILEARLALAEKHLTTFQYLSTVQTRVLEEELIDWKRKQQLAGNGGDMDGAVSLEMLQQWCETLADLICINRQQVKKVELLRTQLPIDVPLDREDLLPRLFTTITGLLSSLVTSTFIIEKQPPQVLKKDSRFMASVRLLVGGKLNVHMNPPQVRASIISEAQARGLLRSEKSPKTENSGEILNNVGTMEYHQATGQLSVTFRNMQLKRIKRADRKGTEAVTEEKFSILFQSQFSVGAGELVFQVWTLSLPVVVTVHGNQECNALATVLWDNAFAEPGRQPFYVPEKVPWPLLAEALNCRFRSAVGSGLSIENTVYLAQKLFGSNQEDFSNQSVSWSQFNKEQLSGRNFSFWEWFYAILKLTKEHLRSHWNDRAILGFVGKGLAQDVLIRQPKGTFLLRFSDSEVGGVTIAWVADDPAKPGEPQVWNLAPYTAKDFTMRSLADRIKDLTNLVWLYPERPKETVFGKYWTTGPEGKSKSKHGGYVGSVLKDTIPELMERPAAPMACYDQAQSPLNIQPLSPASSTMSQSQYDPSCMGAGHGVVDMDDDIDTILNGMDYGADDISSINVNALLENFNRP
ncbi:signal transducer and activator of transcription 5A-like isoform X2 [Lineus longissimus]